MYGAISEMIITFVVSPVLRKSMYVYTFPHDYTQSPYRRRAFTKEEDLFLARYIASRLPSQDTGGRMGNKIYKELTKRAAEVRVFLFCCCFLRADDSMCFKTLPLSQ